MKLQQKITICVVLILAVTFGIGASMLIESSFKASLLHEQEMDLRTYEIVLNSLDNVIDSASSTMRTDMHTILYQLDRRDSSWSGIRLKSDNYLVYQNEGRDLFLDNELPASSTKCLMQIIKVRNERYYQISSRFQVNGEKYRFDMLFDLNDLYWSRNVQLRKFLGIFWGVIVIGFFLSYIFSRLLTRSLRNVSATLRKITAGDLTCRAKVETDDEVGDVALALNHMTDRLEKNIEKIHREMDKKEEFLGGFSHEVKTPITAIIGYSDLMRRDVLSVDETRDAANYIFSEGKRLESLSKKMLDLVVLGKDEVLLREFRPKQLLENVVVGIQPILEEAGISVSMTTEDGECLLEPDLFSSLVINVLDNARKAIGNKCNGKIEITQTMMSGGCCIIFSDNGCGIPQKELDKVTEAFYRVDKSRSRAQGGVGLGLSLCKRIVELHNGKIRFYSELGKGTRVVITLGNGVVCEK